MTSSTRFARALIARHRAEVETLAVAVNAPRAAVEIFRGIGVTDQQFVNLDSLAMFHVIQAAGVPEGVPWPAEKILLTIRWLLLKLDRWDDSDLRPFVTFAHRWGPGPLVRWFNAIEFGPDRLRVKIRQIQRLDAVQIGMINQLQEAA